MSDPVEEAAKLPLNQRLEHSHWKVRSNAYEELAKKFSEALESNASMFHEYSGYFKKMLNDKNAAAMEKGLEPIYAFYDRYDHAPKFTPSLAPLIITQCLGARQGTKQRAIEVLMLMVEVDNSAEQVVLALVEGAGNKVPKVAIASIQTLELVIKTFGVKVVPLKPILAAFLGWFEHTNADARAAAQNLTIELYKWVGGVILDKPVATLRQAQVTELQKAFADIPKGQAVPEKYLRSQADQMQAAAAAGSGGAAAAPVEEIDPYTMVEAFPLASKITPDQYELLQSKKWKDKKETLEAINKIADTPRLASGDYGELIKNLKRLLGDANVFVVEESIRCLGFLANGLRAEFTGTAKSTMPVLLDKLKERKDKVITALQNTFDAYHPHCFALADIQEDINVASKHKVPGVKKEMLNWFKRALPKEKRPLLTKSLKFWCTLFMELMNDPDSPVRENAFECFGLLIGMLGERQLTGYLNQMDKVKEKRVREFIPAAPIPAPAGGAAPSASSAPQVDVNAGVNLADVKSETKPAAKKAATAAPSSSSAPAGAKKSAAPAKASSIAQPVSKSRIPTPGASSSNTPQPTSVAASSKPAPIETFSSEPRITAAEAEGRVMDLLGETVIAQLSDKDWKQRLDAMSIIASTVERWDAGTAQQWSETLLLFLMVARPSFKEPNVQVLAKMIEVLKRLCSGWLSTSANKADVYVALVGIVDHIHEAKLTAPSIDFLNTVSENPALGLQYVYNSLYTLLKETKALKAQVEGMAWITSSLAEFSAIAGGSHGVLVDSKNLVNFIKTVALESTNATIKATGIRVLCEIYKQMNASGSSSQLMTMLSDVKPQLMTTIKKELDKVAHDKPASAVRGPNAPPRGDGEDLASGGGASSASASSTADLPRVDISAQIAAALPGFSNNDWQKRQEAMASLESVLLEVRKIQPKGISALMAPLKSRLSDSNINLIPLALSLLGELASASGPTIESHIKTVMPQILACYSNNKSTIRAACGACLDKWVEEVGMDPILPYLPTALGTPSGRAELLAWISTKIHYVKKGDVKVLLKPAFQCYQDKTKEVRTVAETAIIELARKLGGNGKVIEQECSKLAPAVLANVRTLLKNNEAEIAKKVVPPSSSSTAGKSRIPLPGSLSGSPSPAASPRKFEPSTASSASSVTIETPNTTVASTADIPSSSSPSQSGPLLRNNKKEERELAEVPWIFDVSAPAKLIDILREQMSVCVTPELLDLMFSSDAKSHSAAIGDLERAIDGKHEAAVLDSLDVILKWISWRLLHPNAAIVKKVVGLLEHLIGTLDIWEHKMSDLEAESFVPLLVVRLPHMSEALQSSIRSILSTVETNFFAPSKIFKLFVSKYYRNWTGSQLQPQSKCEVLSYLGSFIRRQTLAVCDPAEAFKALSSLLSSADAEDPSVIIATLDVFLEAAKDLTENESLWSYIASEHHDLVKAYITAPTSETLKKFKIGESTSDDADLDAQPHSSTVEIKSTTKPTSSQATSDTKPGMSTENPAVAEAPSKPTPVLEKVAISKTAKFTLDLDKLEVPVITDERAASRLPTGVSITALPTSVTSDPTPVLPSRHASRTADAASQHRAQAQVSQASQVVSTWVRQLKACGTSTETTNIIEVLKEIHGALTQDFRSFAFHVEPMIAIILEKIRTHFDVVAAPTGSTASAARMSLLTVLACFLRDENTAQFISESHVKIIIPTLVDAMLNAQSIQGETETLITTTNQLVVAALNYCNKTSILVALVSVLRERLVQLQSISSSDSYGSQMHNNFLDVTRKCVTRVLKAIPSSMAKISVPSVLYEVHLFFAAHPPYIVLHGPKQSTASVSSFEAVKALVDKLVETIGSPVVRFIGAIPAVLPPPAILWYIKSSLLSHSPNVDSSVLQQIPAADVNPETSPNGALTELSESQNGASILAHVQPRPALAQPEYRLPVPSSEEMKQTALRHVFGKISKKETSSIGLLDLYWLLKDHPDINVDIFLAPTSQAFRHFIHDQLKRLAAIERVSSANAHELEIMSREDISHLLSYSQEAAAQLNRLRSLQSKLKIGKPSSTVVTGVDLEPAVLSTMVSHSHPKEPQSHIAALGPTTSTLSAGSASTGTSGGSSAASSFRERLRNATSTNESTNASKFGLPSLAPTTQAGLDLVSSNTGSASVSASSFALPTLSATPTATSTSPTLGAPTSSSVSSSSSSVASGASISSIPAPTAGVSASSAAARLAAITSGASLSGGATSVHVAPPAATTTATPSQIPAPAPASGSTSSVESMRERLARIKGNTSS